MNYKKLFIIFALFSIQLYAAQDALIASSEGLFVPYTTTAKIKFYTRGTDNITLYPYLVQGGTLKESGREGIVVTRVTDADIKGEEANTNNQRFYELPAGAPKILVVGYTNWAFADLSLAVVFAGTQDGVYALLWEDNADNNNVTGGYPQGPNFNMGQLGDGYWNVATMRKIFEDTVKRNVVAFAAKGNGVYYVLRGTDITKIEDVVYRFIPTDFADGIENATPTKLFTSGKNGLPDLITSLEVAPGKETLRNNTRDKEQLIIGTDNGAYITNVEGGIQAADIDAATITPTLIPNTQGQIIKALISDGDNTADAFSTIHIIGKTVGQDNSDLTQLPLTVEFNNNMTIYALTEGDVTSTTYTAVLQQASQVEFPDTIFDLSQFEIITLSGPIIIET